MVEQEGPHNIAESTNSGSEVNLASPLLIDESGTAQDSEIRPVGQEFSDKLLGEVGAGLKRPWSTDEVLRLGLLRNMLPLYKNMSFIILCKFYCLWIGLFLNR